jgi:hypothetical protein
VLEVKFLFNLDLKLRTYSNIMTKTVSFGFVLPPVQQSKSARTPLPTIVHSTVVGRRSFGALKTTPSREVFHLVTRRRSSAA